MPKSTLWDQGSWFGRFEQPNYPLQCYIYYWVGETQRHWFIGYADFHPTDRWEINTELTSHENDMEGLMLVIVKDGSTYGQFLLMITAAHLPFYSYKDFDTSPSQDVTDAHETIDGDVEFYEGHRPYVYVEAKGHTVSGDKRWEAIEFPGEDGVVRYYQGVAEETAGSLLERLRDTNLKTASLDEKAELVAKLAVKIYPSEDLTHIRIFCGLNVTEHQKVSCHKISIASPKL